MARKLLRFALCAFLSVCPLFAVLNGDAVTMKINPTTKQTTTITGKRSDGSKDRVTTRVQTLEIECLSAGLLKQEKAVLRWAFLSKDPLNGKFEYHSIGSKDVIIPVTGSMKVSVKSEPMKKDEYTQAEGLSITQYTAANIPVGWSVFLVQNGVAVKESASNPSLTDWMRRNPPPAKKD